jgi:two-component system OmpR family sensor kinase
LVRLSWCIIEPEASRKRLQITWVNDLHGELPVVIENVRQVVLNLLINACAATPAGGTVHLLARAAESWLTIEVGDQGPGLQDDVANYLVGLSEVAPGTGRGLGLWIVRRLVADEDGEIRVIQEKGLSTLIRVTWPFHENLSRRESARDAVSVEAIHAE